MKKENKTSSINKNLKTNMGILPTNLAILKSFALFITVKTITKLNLGEAIEINKISRRGPLWVKTQSSVIHVVVLQRQRNVLTHVHRLCSFV